MVGGQRLTELRDRLTCRSDADMAATGLSVPSGGRSRVTMPTVCPICDDSAFGAECRERLVWRQHQLRIVSLERRWYALFSTDSCSSAGGLQASCT